MIYSFKTSDRTISLITLLCLEKAMKDEKESHIAENMVGDVTWSLKYYLDQQTRFANNGYISVVMDGDNLIGIGGCELNDLVFPDSLQFGIRLWVHPKYRHERIPTTICSHHLKFAHAMFKTAWTSFNPDREAMLRMIAIRAKDSDPSVSQLWADFKVLEEKVMLNNVVQSIAYKNFS